MAGLRDRQKLFIDEYLKCWNASEAARRAGYSEKTAGSIGSENLKKPEIRAEIDRRLKESAMGADEVLSRLAEQARASIEDFFTLEVTKDAAGNRVIGEMAVDFDKAIQAGKMHLVKSIRQDKDGNWRIEMYDAQAALVQLGRHHKLFTDQVEVLDWRAELRRMGMNDGDIENILTTLTNRLAADLTRRPGTADGGGAAES